MNIYKNKTRLIANIILHGELLKALCLRLRMRLGCPILPFLFKIVLEILVNVIIKKSVKIFEILYLTNNQNITKTLWVKKG